MLSSTDMLGYSHSYPRICVVCVLQVRRACYRHPLGIHKGSDLKGIHSATDNQMGGSCSQSLKVNKEGSLGAEKSKRERQDPSQGFLIPSWICRTHVKQDMAMHMRNAISPIAL